jgi:sulfur carrier protein
MVKVNGEMQDINGRSVSEALGILGYDAVKVAVELNENIVPKAEYSTTILSDGDSVEVVRFVGRA